MASYLPPTLGSVFNSTPFLYGGSYLSLQEAFKYFLPKTILNSFFSEQPLSTNNKILTINLSSTFINCQLTMSENVSFFTFLGTPAYNQIKLIITGDSSTDYSIIPASTEGQLPILFNGGALYYTITANTKYIADISTDGQNWYFNFTQF